jgi:Trypsin-co-occurring domain 1
MTEIKVLVVSPDDGNAMFGIRNMPDFKERAKDVGNSLKEIAVDLRAYLDNLEQRREGWDVDEVSLEFSLDLQAGAGVVLIGNVSGTAGFRATMTWRRLGEVAEL